MFYSSMNNYANISSSMSIAEIRRNPCERDGWTIVAETSYCLRVGQTLRIMR
jgi:hypothetical protein